MIAAPFKSLISPRDLTCQTPNSRLRPKQYVRAVVCSVMIKKKGQFYKCCHNNLYLQTQIRCFAH